jgi:peroxiredoxin
MNLRTTTVFVVALVCWGTAAAQGRNDAGDGTRVRGAHEAARNPGKVYKDDLGLTVPGTPIEHPARVYPATDAFPTGPDVGERLPDFALPNQHGERIDFQRDRAGRKAVVAFVRSAVWCSYCMTQLVELQERIQEFRSAGFEVYAISYDPQAALRRFADRYAITYHLLSDAGSEVIRRFGILNTLIDPGDRRAWPYYGVPFPGTYVTNQSGIVTEKFFNRHYATRVSSATILDTALGRVLPAPSLRSRSDEGVR